MMQKRKSYLSLLLASFLLLFTFSFAAAQYEISFENKDVARCVTADMNVYVTNAEALGAFEVIFEVSGDFDSFTFTAAALGFSSDVDVVGNIVRVSGFMGDVAGDVCLGAGMTTIGTLHFETSDLCTGEITVVSATVDDPFTHGSLMVGCDPIVEFTPTFVDGALAIINQAPELTCPDDMTVHFGELVSFDVTGSDADNCETILYSIPPGSGSPAAATIDPFTGHVNWTPSGEDVCVNTIVVRLTDKCGEFVECDVEICVYNTPPQFTDDGATGWMDETIYSVWGVSLSDDVEAADFGPFDGPSALNYTILSFNGETSAGAGLTIDPATGTWTWDIGHSFDYQGVFELCIKVDDGANICDPVGCNTENADTVCIDISVTGYFVDIDNVDGGAATNYKGVIQGTNVTVPVRLRDDPSWKGDPTDFQIGGFDFLISYDASALTALSVVPGELTDDEFEYFTYRFVDNCGGSCPSGILRIVGLRESNDGILNLNHVESPGTLALINFYVTSNLTLDCQFVPIRFYWRDCGDNTMSDETGNILYLGLHVYDFENVEITDPLVYGYSGPMGNCYDTVSVDPFKAPLGAIQFRNGGIKIICTDDIDGRGDVNLNGIDYEVADAVVFTNYFIQGLAAFTISIPGQSAATDANADGTPLTVADLVYLIRVIIGDALPYAYVKLAPSEMINVDFNGDIVNLTGTDVSAALFVFDNEIVPALTDETTNMSIKHGYINGMTHVLVYSMDNLAMNTGSILNISGDANLVGVEAADQLGTPLEVSMKVIPDNFELAQNYPNPFNPETVIGLSLPVASNWNISIYNVSGQMVKEFSGYSEAGIINVVWDATDVASGMYFYKATTDTHSATKKMVLLK